VVAVSRRGFLVASAALVLGGCGVDAAGTAPPTDAEVLTGLLDTEVAAGAPVIDSPVTELLVRQDARHVERLAALAGVAAPGPASDAAVDLAAALARKQEAVFAYIAALPKLADPAARGAVMEILASEAEHIAALRHGAGQVAAPDPFAGFMEPA
jgi:hypothetical protein